MQTISFSKNWNNKLDCLFFSTIRVYDVNHHVVGRELLISLKGREPRKAVIISVWRFLLPNLSDGIAGIAAALSANELRVKLYKMYKLDDHSAYYKLFAFIVLKYIE